MYNQNYNTLIIAFNESVDASEDVKFAKTIVEKLSKNTCYI